MLFIVIISILRKNRCNVILIPLGFMFHVVRFQLNSKKACAWDFLKLHQQTSSFFNHLQFSTCRVDLPLNTWKFTFWILSIENGHSTDQNIQNDSSPNEMTHIQWLSIWMCIVSVLLAEIEQTVHERVALGWHTWKPVILNEYRNLRLKIFNLHATDGKRVIRKRQTWLHQKFFLNLKRSIAADSSQNTVWASVDTIGIPCHWHVLMPSNVLRMNRSDLAHFAFGFECNF